MEKNIEKFKEFIKNKDNKSLETEIKIEELEMKETQVEEKKFLNRIKESARYFFHIAPKKNFKKAMRVAALATALSMPVGEKVFAEREINVKEQTVVTVQIDKEISKLEQVGETEEFKEIIKQRQLLKEKYGAEVVGKNSEYTLEELQDFDEALGKVQKFAPKQFGELKIALLKMYSSDFFNADMKVFPNLCERLEILEEMKINLDQNYKEKLFEYKQKILNNEKILENEESYINSAKTHRSLDFLEKLLNIEDNIKYGTIVGAEKNYDILLSCDKKNVEKLVKDMIKEGRRKAMYTPFLALKESFYKDLYIHELSHLITLNNYHLYHKELADKFDKINKKISVGSDKKITEKNGLERYLGFVSDYAASDKVVALLESGFRSKDYDVFFGLRNVEDIAETMTYMINNHHYADDDLIVQEKIKAIKESLA